MQQRMSETFSMLERDQAGYGVMNALTAVVNALKLVPGRKSVLYFSEGLILPPNVQPRFLSLIDEANRANVAVYAMDAKGLRAESTQAEARDEINAYASNRLNSGERSIGAGGAASRYLEINEDRLRMDPSSGLGQLAQETGGFLIQGSNNFDRGFNRVTEDIRAHYVLTYASSRPTYDGKFRSIGVKVKREGLTVSHRKGYYAVPPSADGAPVLAFEAPGSRCSTPRRCPTRSRSRRVHWSSPRAKPRRPRPSWWRSTPGTSTTTAAARRSPHKPW